MKSPSHPGRSIKDACLEPRELNVTEGAKVLGVARHTLSRVIHGHAGIAPEMAVRLEKADWSNPDHWLRLQAAKLCSMVAVSGSVIAVSSSRN